MERKPKEPDLYRHLLNLFFDDSTQIKVYINDAIMEKFKNKMKKYKESPNDSTHRIFGGDEGLYIDISRLRCAQIIENHKEP